MAAPHHGVPGQMRPGRNTSALAVKCVNNKIIYHYILTVLADATNDLSMPYTHEQRTGAATEGVRLRWPPADGWRWWKRYVAVHT